mgnify:CR=1 FL=1
MANTNVTMRIDENLKKSVAGVSIKSWNGYDNIFYYGG